MCLRVMGVGGCGGGQLPASPADTGHSRQSLCRPQIPLVVTVGGIEKPMCFKQKPISKFPTLAHQSDEGPAHVVNLSACPLPTSSRPRSPREQKKPAAAAVNPGKMTKPIRPFKSRRKIELNAANGDGGIYFYGFRLNGKSRFGARCGPKYFCLTTHKIAPPPSPFPAVIHLRKTNT